MAPPLPAGAEHLQLVGGGEPPVERQHLGVAVVPPGDEVGRVADFAFARQKDENVAARVELGGEFDAAPDRVGELLVEFRRQV